MSLPEGKYPEIRPTPNERAEYYQEFDSDIPIYEKEETDNEIKNLRT